MSGLAEPIFATKSNVRVFTKGKPFRPTGSEHVKIYCYRSETGGYMGLLKIKNLTPVNQAARVLVSKTTEAQS